MKKELTFYTSDNASSFQEAFNSFPELTFLNDSKSVFFIISKHGDECVGFAVARKENDKKIVLRKIKTDTNISQTNNRVGTKMMSLFCQRAIDLGYDEVYFEDQGAAYEFYEKLGFKANTETSENGFVSYSDDLKNAFGRITKQKLDNKTPDIENVTFDRWNLVTQTTPAKTQEVLVV